MAKQNDYTFIQIPPVHSKPLQQDMLFTKISEEHAASQKDYEHNFQTV